MVNGDTEMSKLALLEKVSVNVSFATYNVCIVTVPTWVLTATSLDESDNVFCVWLLTGTVHVPGRGPCWPSRHRQNRDHQGPGQSLGLALCRDQLRRRHGLQSKASASLLGLSHGSGGELRVGPSRKALRLLCLCDTMWAQPGRQRSRPVSLSVSELPRVCLASSAQSKRPQRRAQRSRATDTWW